MAIMNFCLMQLIQKNTTETERFIYPNKSSFQGIEKEGSFRNGKTFYEFNIEETDKYIWFSFDYGEANPRDDQLTNIQTGEKRDNPRAEDESRRNQTVFCSI